MLELVRNKNIQVILPILISIVLLLLGYTMLPVLILGVAMLFFSITNDYKSILYLLVLIVTQNILLIIFSATLSAKDATIITLYKEVLVYLSVFITVFIKRKFRFEKADLVIGVYLLILAIAFFISDSSISAKLVSARQLLLPIACFAYGRQLQFTEEQYSKLYNVIIYIGIFIAVFGFIEFLFLRDDFWRAIGSELYFKNKGLEEWTNNGVMISFYTFDLNFITHGPLRRLVSIFAEVLASAHFMGLSLIVAFYKYNGIRRNKIIICSILSVAIILTISKGVFLLGGIAVIIAMYYYYNQKKLTKIFLGLGFLTLLFIIVKSTGKATSTGYHLNGLINNFSNLKVLGFGLAKSGNFAMAFNDSQNGITSGESFIGTMLGQIGVLGILSYILYNLYFVKQLINKISISRNEVIIAITFLIGILIESFLSESSISFLGTGMYFIISGMIYTKVFYLDNE